MEALFARCCYRNYNPHIDEYTDFVYYRSPHRLLGGALLGCIVCLPTSALAFRSPAFHRFRAAARVPFFMPLRLWTAAALGGAAGLIEDLLVRVSYEETLANGRPVDVAMWTARSLGPAVACYAHPFLAWKCMDGEQKGCDAAMAQIEGKGFQQWPFFSVQQSNEGQWERLRRRLWDGTYTSEEADNRSVWEAFWHPVTSVFFPPKKGPP